MLKVLVPLEMLVDNDTQVPHRSFPIQVMIAQDFYSTVFFALLAARVADYHVVECSWRHKHRLALASFCYSSERWNLKGLHRIQFTEKQTRLDANYGMSITPEYPAKSEHNE